MLNLSKKSLVLFLVLIAVATATGWFFVRLIVRTEREIETIYFPSVQYEKKVKKIQQIVLDINPNIDDWQTKETEFFTIKFPKEWFWLESDREQTGYGSQVITNNPNFPVNKYADIGVFIGEYPSIIMDNSEFVMTFTAWPTMESFEPGDKTKNAVEQSLDSKARIIRNSEPEAVCKYLSNPKNARAILRCSFVSKNRQKIQNYVIANDNITVAYTIRSTENSLIPESIFKKIIDNAYIVATHFD